MGLDFSHCDARWSYSGFGRFRRRLWNDSGFTGDLYELYDGDEWLKQIDKNHPLFGLFNHSDCEGVLTPEQMKKISPAVARIVRKWPDGDYDKESGFELVSGMNEAIEAGENLEFL